MPALSKSELKARARKAARRKTLVSYVLLLPYLILMVMFAVFPVFYAFVRPQFL